MNKYIPLAVYEYNAVTYCVFARMKKSGMISFSVKRITGLAHCAYLHLVIDTQKQWDKLLSKETV